MRYIIALLFTTISVVSFGQDLESEDEINQRKASNNLRFRGSLRSLSKVKDPRKGNPYLIKEFTSGLIKFSGENKEYRVKSMRYNSLYDYLEVKHDGEDKILDGNKLDAMMINHKGIKYYYVSGKFFQIGPINLTGFVQVVEKGKLQLLKQTKTTIKKATYNVSLNVGNNYDEIIHSKVYYFAVKNKLTAVKSKRSIYKFFKSKGFDAKAYIKKYKIKTKTEAGLSQLVKAYNTSSVSK